MTEKSPKVAKFFYCEYCDYKCCKQSDYNKHILTSKHKMAMVGNENGNEIQQKPASRYICSQCGKTYKDNSGLWKHKKQCIKQEPVTDLVIIEEPKPLSMTSDMVLALIKEELTTIVNQQNTNTNSDYALEFMKQTSENQMQMFQQMMEFMKQQCATTNNINNGQINNNNTHFNLQVYLNETCKNAMNIDQFIEYLQPTLQELEDTARLGYVEGITRIIMRGLKDLEENERPFHCSDLKRETMFVKNNNDIWEKEPDEKPQLMKVVKAISRKNFCNVSAWQKEHPTWRNHDSKHNDQYNQILVNSTSGSTEEEQKNSYEKIIRNIIKETVINKSKKNC